MREMFHLGGFGMWPTLVFGLLMIATSVRYAFRPERRFVPLMIATGLLTLFAGVLGFWTGVAKSLLGLSHATADTRWIGWIGLGESMMNVELALMFLTLATLVAAVGAWRLSHGEPARAE